MSTTIRIDSSSLKNGYSGTQPLPAMLVRTSEGHSESVKRHCCTNMNTLALFAKIFWVFIMAAGSAILIYGLYKTRVEYSMSSKLLNQQQRPNAFNMKPVKEMDFPEVYICPTNYINSTMMKDVKSSNHVLRLFRQSLIFKHQTKSKRDANEEDPKSKPENLYDTFMNIGFEQSEVFKSCAFRTFFMEQLKCANVVRSVLDPNFGKCFLVSVGERKQQVPGQGLILVLNLNTELFPDTGHDNLAPMTRGFVLRIAKQVDPGNFELIYLNPGTYTKVDITEEHFLYNDEDCVSSSNNGENRIKILNGNYTQSRCLLDCLMQTVHRACKCIPLIDKYFLQSPYADTVKYCDMDEIKHCVLPNVTESQEGFDHIEQCRSRCSPACEQWKYGARLSQVPLNEGADVFVRNNDTVSDMMFLHLAYPNLEFSEYRQNVDGNGESVYVNSNYFYGQNHESLWVIAAIVLIVQAPVIMSIICLWGMYGRIHQQIFMATK